MATPRAVATTNVPSAAPERRAKRTAAARPRPMYAATASPTPPGDSHGRIRSQSGTSGQHTASSPVTSVATCLYVNQASPVSVWSSDRRTAYARSTCAEGPAAPAVTRSVSVRGERRQPEGAVDRQWRSDGAVARSAGQVRRRREARELRAELRVPREERPLDHHHERGG